MFSSHTPISLLYAVFYAAASLTSFLRLLLRFDIAAALQRCRSTPRLFLRRRRAIIISHFTFRWRYAFLYFFAV